MAKSKTVLEYVVDTIFIPQNLAATIKDENLYNEEYSENMIYVLYKKELQKFIPLADIITLLPKLKNAKILHYFLFDHVIREQENLSNNNKSTNKNNKQQKNQAQQQPLTFKTIEVASNLFDSVVSSNNFKEDLDSSATLRSYSIMAEVANFMYSAFTPSEQQLIFKNSSRIVWFLRNNLTNKSLIRRFFIYFPTFDINVIGYKFGSFRNEKSLHYTVLEHVIDTLSTYRSFNETVISLVELGAKVTSEFDINKFGINVMRVDKLLKGLEEVQAKYPEKQLIETANKERIKNKATELVSAVKEFKEVYISENGECCKKPRKIWMFDLSYNTAAELQQFTYIVRQLMKQKIKQAALKKFCTCQVYNEHGHELKQLPMAQEAIYVKVYKTMYQASWYNKFYPFYDMSIQFLK